MWNERDVQTPEHNLVPVRIEVKNGDINGAIKKLKKFVFSERILFDYMKHEAFEKPSMRKRRERAESILRVKRENEKRIEERGY